MLFLAIGYLIGAALALQALAKNIISSRKIKITATKKDTH